MMHQLYVLLPLFLISTLGAMEPRYLLQARVIVDRFKNAGEGVNVYGSGSNHISQTTARTQCATFVTLLFEDTYGDAWTNMDMYRWMSSTFPYAKDYYNAIDEGKPGWRNIRDIRRAQPGDILAAKYPPEEQWTGHVMILVNISRMNSKSPLIDNTIQYEVWVVDSSASYHGPLDTRAPPHTEGGIGIGVIRLFTSNLTHEIVGYTWSMYSNSEFYPVATRPIILGRPDKVFEKAEREYSFRNGRQRFMIPAYLYPSGSKWASIPTIKSPDAAGIVIVNPNSGPGNSLDENYAIWMRKVREQSGAKMIGYTFTKYGKREPWLVKGDIDKYRQLYGDHIEGFFLDEASSTAEDIAYYTDLATYIRAVQNSSYIVLNPGTIPADGYMTISDTIVIHEDHWSDSLKHEMPQYEHSYGTSKYCVLYHTTPNTTSMVTTVQNWKRKGVGYIYVTDDSGNNPWDALPSFYELEAAEVASEAEPLRRGVYLSLNTDRSGAITFSSKAEYAQFEYILDSEQKISAVFQWLSQQNFNAISLYNLHTILPGKETALRAFISRARREFNIRWVEAIAAESLSKWDDIADYQNSSLDDDEMFDGCLTEIEFWNSDDDVQRIVTPVEYMKTSNNPKSRLATRKFYYAAYIGWPTASDMNVLGAVLDYIFLHAYVKDATKAFRYTKGRLTDLFATPHAPKIIPIFSSEGEAISAGSEKFMGDWLQSNNIAVAENNYTWSFFNEYPGHSGVLRGYQWFSYFFTKMYAPPLPANPPTLPGINYGSMATPSPTTAPPTSPSDGGGEDGGTILWVIILICVILVAIVAVVVVVFVFRKSPPPPSNAENSDAKDVEVVPR